MLNIVHCSWHNIYYIAERCSSGRRLQGMHSCCLMHHTVIAVRRLHTWACWRRTPGSCPSSACWAYGGSWPPPQGLPPPPSPLLPLALVWDQSAPQPLLWGNPLLAASCTTIKISAVTDGRAKQCTPAVPRADRAATPTMDSLASGEISMKPLSLCFVGKFATSGGFDS